MYSVLLREQNDAWSMQDKLCVRNESSDDFSSVYCIVVTPYARKAVHKMSYVGNAEIDAITPTPDKRLTTQIKRGSCRWSNAKLNKAQQPSPWG
ncbi:hypothetical protein O1611_g6703 [Lasiodiplodia mahajangana]|uniref:Uncharacterized protein n=1 Tax=Lasiodiplodia mahajangana TaxID=1108764 RepID=A0ACC2JHE3_9PEZI|nr:hypothetical protein O1611_g6703 [Lasiodiplodia mahajangana]